MSLPLKDLRTAVPESTDTWLEIDARVRGTDKAAVAREWLNEIAKQKAHAFKVAHRVLRTNGAQTDWLGDDTDDDGSRPESVGVSRKTR